MPSDTITCGICGYMYMEETKGVHDKVHGAWNGSVLPTYIVNSILYWADQILRKINLESEDPVHMEEVDTAIWVTMHMWYNREHEKVKGAELQNVLFKSYRDELNNRYPALRRWQSGRIGTWEL